MIIPFNEIKEILMSEKSNKFVLSILCADTIALFLLPRRIWFLWCIFGFCSVWLIWSILVCIYAYVIKVKDEEWENNKNELKRQKVIDAEKRLAKDAFDNLDELHKKILCYAIISGKISAYDKNVRIFNMIENSKSGLLNFVNHVSPITHPYKSFTFVETQGNLISIKIYPELESLVEEEIMSKGYNQENIETYLNEHFNKR